jgi:hypothetical protein
LVAYKNKWTLLLSMTSVVFDPTRAPPVCNAKFQEKADLWMCNVLPINGSCEGYRK